MRGGWGGSVGGGSAKGGWWERDWEGFAGAGEFFYFLFGFKHIVLY